MRTRHLCIPLLLLTACSSRSEHEAVAADTVDHMEQLVKILEGVTDEKTAQAAKAQLEPIVARLRQLQEKMEKMGEPPAAEAERFQATFGARMAELTQRMMQTMMRLSGNEKAMSQLQSTLDKMK